MRQFKGTFVNHLCVLGTLLTAVSSLAELAKERPFYIWDNQEGLVLGNNCRFAPDPQNRFAMIQASDSSQNELVALRDAKLSTLYNLGNGTLVKTIPSTLVKNHTRIEVIALNASRSASERALTLRAMERSAARFDKGYVENARLIGIENTSLILKDGTPVTRSLPLQDKVLRLMKADENNFVRAECSNTDKSRDYKVFAIYSDEKASEAMAYVGVYFDETKLFQSFESRPTANPDYALANELIKKPVTVNALPQIMAYVPWASGVLHSMLRSNEVYGSMRFVVCDTSLVDVRDVSLKKVVFKALPGEDVKIFQGWGVHSKTDQSNSKPLEYVRVQLSVREERDQKVGFILRSQVSLESECAPLKVSRDVGSLARSSSTPKAISGLNDSACCNFPTSIRPSSSYLTAPRAFGSSRSKGRSHGACDLYRKINEASFAVAPGKISLGLYEFYQGTYALEVIHSGGFVVRYGELTAKRATNIYSGKTVETGQRVGYIGKVNSNCCEPMLHFELYSGKSKGSLSGGGKYQRRSDLMNPTSYLLKWEKNKFGMSFGK